jgi:HEAT repeat protein
MKLCFAIAVAMLQVCGCLEAQTTEQKAWSTLSAAAQDKSWEKRSKAIQALGIISGNQRAQTMAEAALKDEREDVRASAADALGLMGATSSASTLKAMISDPAAAVVFAVANALFVLGDQDAYKVYYAVLTGTKKTGDPLVESQMKMLRDPKALSKFGFAVGIGFIPFGGVGYKVFRMVSEDTESPVRAAAAIKLTDDPDPKAGEALADATRDPKWLVRAAVAGAIAKRGDTSLANALAPLLDDENDVVRFNAAAAVIHLKTPARADSKRSGTK